MASIHSHYHEWLSPQKSGKWFGTEGNNGNKNSVIQCFVQLDWLQLFIGECVISMWSDGICLNPKQLFMCERINTKGVKFAVH